MSDGFFTHFFANLSDSSLRISLKLFLLNILMPIDLLYSYHQELSLALLFEFTTKHLVRELCMLVQLQNGSSDERQPLMDDDLRWRMLMENDL